MDDPCDFDILLARNVPRILEKIFLSLDFPSFKACRDVSRTWRELLAAKSFKKKAFAAYPMQMLGEIIKKEHKLIDAAKEGNVQEVRLLLASGVNPSCKGTYEDPKYSTDLAIQNGFLEVGREEEFTFMHSKGIEQLWQPSMGGLLKSDRESYRRAYDYARPCTDYALETPKEEFNKMLLKMKLNPLNLRDDYEGRAIYSSDEDDDADDEEWLFIPRTWEEEDEDEDYLPDEAEEESSEEESSEEDSDSEGNEDEGQNGTDELINEHVVKILDDEKNHRKKVCGINISVRGRTPLFWAVLYGHKEVVQVLLDAKAKENPEHGNSDDYYDLVLNWAAKCGHQDIVHLVLKAGAQPNIKGSKGKTPLFWAVNKGHKIMVQQLLIAGADPNEEQSIQMSWDGEVHMDLKYVDKYPLNLAAKNDNQEIIKLLINAGSDPNTKDYDGRTPLFWAVFNGNTDMEEDLLKAGANKYDVPNESPSLFDMSTKNGYEEVVKDVVQALLDNNSDDYHNIVLNWASKCGYQDIVCLVLKAGAQPNIKGSEGKTPLFWAVEKGYKIMVKQLLRAGADPNEEPIEGKSLLNQAAANGSHDIVRLLIEAGARPNTEENDGITCLS